MSDPAAPALPCPHCAGAMREVVARARTGYLIPLDQCPQCGGVWCDRWELFPLAAEEARRIDSVEMGRRPISRNPKTLSAAQHARGLSETVEPVDQAQLHAATADGVSAGRCPRCTTTLQPFRDPMLPADARIERCRVCDGMWMNRGALSRAKQRSPPTRGASQAALDSLASTVGADSTWSKVTNLDAATYAVDSDPADDASETRAVLWSTAPWIVLRTLLRLLLGV